MNKTKTEDLIDFGPKGKDKTKNFYYVIFYMDGALIGTTVSQAKSRTALKKKILEYIDIKWPADKEKISYQIK